MPFYLRKGLSFGPLRLNISKGGLGVSVGGKGLRAGIDADGKTYTHAGRFGLYHRSSPGGVTFGWVLILLLGLGLWWAQTQGWFDHPTPKHRTTHHARHRTMDELGAE